MDSINTILDDKDYSEPESAQQLKEYISSIYKSAATIRTGPKGLTIIVSNSSLANTIRLHLPEIKRQLNLSENVRVRIG